MTRSHVDVREKDTVYDGYFRIDRYRLRHALHGGGWSGDLTREVFERGHTVSVLPYDSRRDEVVLVEQFRIGPYAAGDERPWMLEVVAGVIEPGERIEDVARRETLEETGLEPLGLERIAGYYVSPGGTSQFNHLYCVRVDARGAGGIHGIDHEGEDIRVVAVPRDRLPGLIAEGDIRDATTLIALQWLLARPGDPGARRAASP